MWNQVLLCMVNHIKANNKVNQKVMRSLGESKHTVLRAEGLLDVACATLQL